MRKIHDLPNSTTPELPLPSSNATSENPRNLHEGGGHDAQIPDDSRQEYNPTTNTPFDAQSSILGADGGPERAQTPDTTIHGGSVVGDKDQERQIQHLTAELGKSQAKLRTFLHRYKECQKQRAAFEKNYLAAQEAVAGQGQRIDELLKTTSELKEKNDELCNKVAEQTQVITDLKAMISQREGRIAELSESTSQNNNSDEVAKQNRSITELSDIITQREQRIAALSETATNQIQTITELSESETRQGRRITELLKVAARQRQKITDLSETVTQQRQEITELSENGARQGQKNTELSDAASKQYQEINELNETVFRQRKEITELTERIARQVKKNPELTDPASKQSQKIAELSETIAQQTQSIAELSESATTQTQKYDVLLETAAKLRQQTTELSETVAQQSQTITEFTQATAQHQEEIAGLRQTIVGLSASTSELSLKNVSLSETVTNQEQQITTLTETSARQTEENAALTAITAEQRQTIATLSTTLSQQTAWQIQSNTSLTLTASRQSESILTLSSTLLRPPRTEPPPRTLGLPPPPPDTLPPPQNDDYFSHELSALSTALQRHIFRFFRGVSAQHRMLPLPVQEALDATVADATPDMQLTLKQLEAAVVYRLSTKVFCTDFVLGGHEGEGDCIPLYDVIEGTDLEKRRWHAQTAGMISVPSRSEDIARELAECFGGLVTGGEEQHLRSLVGIVEMAGRIQVEMFRQVASFAVCYIKPGSLLDSAMMEDRAHLVDDDEEGGRFLVQVVLFPMVLRWGFDDEERLVDKPVVVRKGTVVARRVGELEEV